MSKSQLSNRAVESVTSERILNRRERQALKLETYNHDNILNTYAIGPINFNFLKFPTLEKLPIDTSKRYHHIGGASHLWRSNRTWTNNTTNRTICYTKNKFTYRPHAAVNPQLPGTPGTKLQSNPLPPYVPHDQRKLRAVAKRPVCIQEQEDPLEFYGFYKDDVDVTAKIIAFNYDAFLTDEQNAVLVQDYRTRIAQLLTHKKIPRVTSDERYTVYVEHQENESPFFYPGESPIERQYVAQSGKADDMYLSAASTDSPFRINHTPPPLEFDDHVVFPNYVDHQTSSQTTGNPFSANNVTSICNIVLPPADIEPYIELPNPFAQQNQVNYPRPTPEPNYDTTTDHDEGICSIPRNMQRTARKLRTVCDKVTTALPTASDAFKSVKKTSEMANDMMERVKSSLSTLFEGTTTAFNIMDFSGHLFNLFYDAINYNLYPLPILITKTAFSFMSILRKIMPTALEELPEPRNQAQAWPHKNDPDNTLFKFFGNTRLLEVGKTFQAFSQIRNGVKSAKEFAAWIFGQLPTGMQDLVTYFFPKEDSIKARFDVFLKQIFTLEHLKESRIKLDPEMLEQCEKESEYLSDVLSVADRDNRDMANLYNRLRTMLIRLIAYNAQYEKLATPRQCPFSIVFHGASRAGKSVLMQRVSQILQRLDKHSGKTSYVRQSGSDHWDSFTDDVYATIFDDWLQDTTYDDVSEYFALVTKQHYIVPMADLPDKGTLNLSRVVLAATNIMNKQAVSTRINSPDALFARIGMRILVEKVADYDPINFEHLRFKLIKTENGQDIIENTQLKFSAIMRVIVAGMRDHYANQALIDKAEPIQDDITELERIYHLQPQRLQLLKTNGRTDPNMTKAYSVSSRRNAIAADEKLMNDEFYADDEVPTPNRVSQGLGQQILEQTAGFALSMIAMKLTYQASTTTFNLYKAYKAGRITLVNPKRFIIVGMTACFMTCALAYKHFYTAQTIEMPQEIEKHLDVIRVFFGQQPKYASVALRYSAEPLTLQQVVTAADYLEKNVRTTDPFYHQVRDTLGDFAVARGFIKTETTSESRTDTDKSQKRTQQLTESRTDNDKIHKRPINMTESRTDNDKIHKRPTNMTESDDNPYLGLLNNSKIIKSPFYGQPASIKRQFTSYDHDEPFQPDQAHALFHAQGMLDPSVPAFVDTVATRILPVALTIYDTTKNFAGTTSIINYVNAIPVDAYKFILPKHFFMSNDGRIVANTKDITYRLVFSRNGVNHPIDFNPKRLTLFTNTGGQSNLDAVIYDVSGTTLPASKSLLNWFIKNAELDKLKDHDFATMVGFNLLNGKPTQFTHNFNINILRRTETYTYRPGVTFTITSGVSYDAATKPGDCGSPIIIHNTTIPGKMIGYHLFGTQNEVFGGAMIISQEMIKRHLGNVPQITVHDPPVLFHTTPRFGQMTTVAQNLTLEMYGEVLNPVNINRKTAYKPTPLLAHFNDLGVGPSEKRINEGSDPLLVGACLFGSEINNIDDTFKEPTLTYLLTKFRNQPAKIFDVNEALNAQGSMDRLNLHTSAGYPHVCFGRSKRTFLISDDQTGIVTFKDDIVRKECQEFTDSWQTDLHNVVWIMSLKDSLEKTDKLTRVFEIPPYEYTIATRAYFGSWIDMMHATVGDHFCCVGINPESFDWSEMTYKLLEKSNYGIDADAPNWDKNLSATFLFWACEAVNRWYKINDPNWRQQHDTARMNIIANLVHSYIIAEWLLFRKVKGMPSGHVLTALFNSVVNMIMHLIWFLISVPDAIKDVAFYDRYVSTCIYGDDSLDAIVAMMLEYLNRNTMMSVYKKYCSMTITSSLKNDELNPYDLLLDLTFLKRGFRQDGIYYKPLLSMKSLYGMLSYVRESAHVSLDYQLLENIRVFFAYAYFYGPDFYNRHRDYFGQYFKTFIIPQYSYYDNKYLFGNYETFKLQ